MIKPKKCKVCLKNFTPRNSMVKVCSIDCSMQYAATERIKKNRLELVREKKHSKANDKSWQLKETEKACNTYVRYRDRYLGCISCGRTDSKFPFHSGHFLAVGSHPELRFEELQINKQCMQCNVHKSGAQSSYRIGLIEKIGLEKVEWIEGPHEPKHYTIPDLIEIRKHYQDKLKQLKDKNAN